MASDRSAEDIFGEAKLVDAKGRTHRAASLAGKHVGLYFSAHWCPPCRAFTPQLVKFYKEINKSRTDFEIVFVSMDNDPGQFRDYLAEMPWLAVSYEEGGLRRSLGTKFMVMGIPSLVVLNPDGSISTKSGREAVSSDPTGEQFPWSGFRSSACGSCALL